MGNKRMGLSSAGKEALESLCNSLEVERPNAIKIALAKGIAKGSQDMLKNRKADGKAAWIIPDNIIKDKEYLLFKHLIVNEVGRALSEDEVSDYMIQFIEHGLDIVRQEISNRVSLEDYRVSILN